MGKKKHKKLKRPRYRDELKAVLDSMLEGVIAVDGRGRVIHINDGARPVAHEPEGGAEGHPLADVVAVRELIAPVERVLAGGEPEAARVRRRRGMRETQFSVRVAPLSGKGGKLAGAVIVLQDVTELERLATVRQEFIANASHELKTPVTAILGLIETLVDTPDVEPATHADYLERVRDQAHRLSALVNDLLALSRLDAPGTAFAREALDLAEPVRDAFDALFAQALARDITLTAVWPRHPVLVQADREGVRQAASNLVDNAIKYTTGGGTVQVRVREAHGTGRLEVEDSGIGIAPEHQERIFERFYRVDRARSREAGGTGLGLAIVKHIVRATGGTLELDSTPGKGSRFRLGWPLAQRGKV